MNIKFAANEVLILQEVVCTLSKKKGKEPQQYGKVNDEVKIISAEHYPVMIVENHKGVRFPVRIEKTKLKPYIQNDAKKKI